MVLYFQIYFYHSGWEHKEVIGIDISKQGIQFASKNDEATMWLAGDIAHLPLKDNSVDIILNILSPANYEEFGCVLKSDGLVIKTVPGKEYLIEIRKAYSKKEHNNSNVIELFKINNHLMREIKVFDRKQFNK